MTGLKNEKLVFLVTPGTCDSPSRVAVTAPAASPWLWDLLPPPNPEILGDNPETLKNSTSHKPEIKQE